MDTEHLPSPTVPRGALLISRLRDPSAAVRQSRARPTRSYGRARSVRLTRGRGPVPDRGYGSISAAQPIGRGSKPIRRMQTHVFTGHNIPGHRRARAEPTAETLSGLHGRVCGADYRKTPGPEAVVVSHRDDKQLLACGDVHAHGERVGRRPGREKPPAGQARARAPGRRLLTRRPGDHREHDGGTEQPARSEQRDEEAYEPVESRSTRHVAQGARVPATDPPLPPGSGRPGRTVPDLPGARLRRNASASPTSSCAAGGRDRLAGRS